jgi:hypothetical protein
MQTKADKLRKQADYQSRRRAELKTKRKCQDCGLARPKKGRTLCTACLADRVERQNRARAEKKFQLDEAQIQRKVTM